MNCKSNKPYPEIKVEKKSKQIANILSHIYASNESELTVILQYSYQTFILEEEKIKKILKDIAEVEMHHLKILGTAITKLGLKPLYGTIKNNFFTPWISTNVNYNTNIKQIFQNNIATEKRAIENYEKSRKLINDIYIKALITKIIEDEQLHVKIFEDIYQNLPN